MHDAGPGCFWRLTDFPDLPPALAAGVLARMRAEGILRRVGHGIYYAPKRTLLGEAPPPTGELVKMLARDARVVPAGLSAYNRLGLTTQVPARPIFATAKNLRLPVADIIIRDHSKYEGASDEALMVLDALAHIDRIPDCPPARAIATLCEMFKTDWLPTVTLDDLARLALKHKPKPRPKLLGLIGLLGDMTGRLSASWRAKLLSQLNPLTKVKLNLEGKLIAPAQRREWQIA